MTIKHLLSEPLKISLFLDDNSFIEFTNKIALENDDLETSIITKKDSINYINNFCPELKINN